MQLLTRYLVALYEFIYLHTFVCCSYFEYVKSDSVRGLYEYVDCIIGVECLNGWSAPVLKSVVAIESFLTKSDASHQNE